MHNSRLRTVQLVGEVHRVGSVNDRQECNGTGRRRNLRQTFTAATAEERWRESSCTTRMLVPHGRERCKSSLGGNHAVGGKAEDHDDGARRRREDPDQWKMWALPDMRL